MQWDYEEPYVNSFGDYPIYLDEDGRMSFILNIKDSINGAEKLLIKGIEEWLDSMAEIN